MKRVLVVEDERELAQLVELHLSDQGYEVACAGDGDRGLELAESGDFDLVVLDLMLPGGVDGLEICQRLRRNARYTPVLMLTARSSELDRVLGLEVGADDYLTKPFSVRELVARVKAIFRRIDALESAAAQATGNGAGDRGAVAERIEAGPLAIEPERRRVMLGGEPVHLTAKEFDLLLHFARSPGRVHTRAELLDSVWGYGHDGYEHTVNSHINRLRSKIEDDPAAPSLILTVWGVGYKFFDPREAG